MANLGGIFSGAFNAAQKTKMEKETLKEKQVAARKKAFLDPVVSYKTQLGVQLENSLASILADQTAKNVGGLERANTQVKTIKQFMETTLPQFQSYAAAGVENGYLTEPEAVALLAEVEATFTQPLKTWTDEMAKFQDERNKIAAETSPEAIEGAGRRAKAIAGGQEEGKFDAVSTEAMASRAAEIERLKASAVEAIKMSPGAVSARVAEAGATQKAKTTAQKTAERDQVISDMKELSALLSMGEHEMTGDQLLRLKELNERFNDDPAKERLSEIKADIATKIRDKGMGSLTEGEKNLVPLLIDPFSMLIGMAGIGGTPSLALNPEQESIFQQARDALKTKDPDAVVNKLAEQYPQMSKGEIRKNLGIQ